MDNTIYFDTGTRSNLPFKIFIGARGCGKTYSTLRNAVIDKYGNLIEPPNEYEGKFLYLRRTSKENELSSSPMANPFKRINQDYKINITPELHSKEGIAIYRNVIDPEAGEYGPVLGYGAGLSTFHNLRGMDFSDVDIIIFDEFIKHVNAKAFKGEGNAFLNLYETIARNREFSGRPPLQVIMLANAITLNSEILLAMRATTELSSMLLRKQYRCSLKERGLYLEVIVKDDFKAAKEETALYRLVRNTDFTKEALDNMFVHEDFTFVRSKTKLVEYKPIFNFTDDYTMYRHKSRYEYFASRKQFNSAPIRYTYSMQDKMANNFEYEYQAAILNRRIYFDDYATKLVFDSILA